MIELTGHHDGCGLTELCRVAALDNPHPVNGAHHHYKFWRILTPKEATGKYSGFHTHPVDPHLEEMYSGEISFQRGPRDDADSVPGTLDGAVLQVLIHRFECFQKGPVACEENEGVLVHLQRAAELIRQRAQERAKRSVLGTYAK